MNLDDHSSKQITALKSVFPELPIDAKIDVKDLIFDLKHCVKQNFSASQFQGRMQDHFGFFDTQIHPHYQHLAQTNNFTPVIKMALAQELFVQCEKEQKSNQYYGTWRTAKLYEGNEWQEISLYLPLSEAYEMALVSIHKFKSAVETVPYKMQLVHIEDKTLKQVVKLQSKHLALHPVPNTSVFVLVRLRIMHDQVIKEFLEFLKENHLQNYLFSKVNFNHKHKTFAKKSVWMSCIEGVMEEGEVIDGEWKLPVNLSNSKANETVSEYIQRTAPKLPFGLDDAIELLNPSFLLTH